MSSFGHCEILAKLTAYDLRLSDSTINSSASAELISGMLAGRVAEYWEPAFEAAMQAAENFEFAHVHPLIDEAIVRSLSEKPDLHLIAELYNRIPLETVLLKKTGLEIFRQTAKAMEDRNRVELYPAQYLTILLNFIARLTQLEEWDEALSTAKKALDLSRKKYSEDPKAFCDALTGSIESTAIILSATGETLREEAIQLLRNTPLKERDLAHSFNNYAGTLKHLGDEPGALASSLESVQLYRDLAARGKPEGTSDYSKGLDAWADDPRPNLAKALVGLSSHQDKAKLHHECLASATEAFEMLFTLTEGFPDQFRDAFGLARHNLGMAKINFEV